MPPEAMGVNPGWASAVGGHCLLAVVYSGLDTEGNDSGSREWLELPGHGNNFDLLSLFHWPAYGETERGLNCGCRHSASPDGLAAVPLPDLPPPPPSTLQETSLGLWEPTCVITGVHVGLCYVSPPPPGTPVTPTHL